MPFDSFMTAALAFELEQKLCGLKVDKVFQPERDEIDFLFHIPHRNRLIINCTASTPYMALSNQVRENPSVPPMMCMLLRKHLSRAKITSVTQLGFDRIIRIAFDSGDEMGFYKSKYLYCEMMGRGSNLIFADENQKILAAFRQNDLTTKFDRIVMVGVPYEPMPQQDKIDPVTCTKEAFFEAVKEAVADTRGDLFFQKQFLGFGKLTAREIVFRATGDAETPLCHCSLEDLWDSFSQVVSLVRNKEFSPCLIYESKEQFLCGESPLDFSFMEIRQFSNKFFIYPCESASEAIEQFYLLRNQKERHRQHYNDIAQILKSCKNRLEKKISLQEIQLMEAQDADKDKRLGDLIIQEMYRIKRGDTELSATDYAVDPPATVMVPLDGMLSPSQNAQKYYRDYNKKKTAQIMLKEQIEIAQKELDYVESVTASLQTASTASDLMQIRQELSHWSYGRRLTTGLKKPQAKKEKPKPKETKSPNGFTLYIGMNNLQNDSVSTVLAEKEDLWFHVKNYHGSHVLLKCEPDRAFENDDIEYAASLAAYYSEVRESTRVEVDYTAARFIKKPGGAKPGFITYKNHHSVIVEPKPIS